MKTKPSAPDAQPYLVFKGCDCRACRGIPDERCERRGGYVFGPGAKEEMRGKKPYWMTGKKATWRKRHVHYVDYASQPDLHVVCSDTWTTPAWRDDDARTKTEGVWNDSTGDMYTFEKEKVDCPSCLAKIRKEPPP